MKNITNFNDFKNHKSINEQLITESKSIDDPFVNVEGSFAGADKTLVGSAVINLFNFVKRKGQQSLLYIYYKPNLYREYMTGLLRYIIRNNMALPKEKTLYSVFYIKDSQGNKIEKSEKINVTFTLEEDGKSISVFAIGSIVKTDKNEVVKDGKYKMTEYVRVFDVVDGKITVISFEDIEEYGSVTPVEDTITPTEEGIQADKYILDFIEKLKNEFKTKDLENDKEFIKKTITDIDEMISFFNSNINDMNELLKSDDLESDQLSRVKQDLDVYKENLRVLEVYKANIKSLEKLKVDIQQPVNQNNVNQQQLVQVENLLFGDYNDILNEEIIGNVVSGTKTASNVIATNVGGQIKSGDQKITHNKRIGDELNKLSQSDIDLNDINFTNQFNKPEIKTAVTQVVLEGKSSIVKIQLSAERMYIKNNGQIDRKLQNNWLKMVETVKNQFGKFMLVDQIDPVYLRSKLGQVDIDKLNTTPSKTSIIENLNQSIKASENSILSKSMKIPGQFSNQNLRDFGMFDLLNTTSTGLTKVIYCLDSIQIPQNGTTYYTYKIIASVKVKELLDNTTNTDFKQYIDKVNLPPIFKPNKLELSNGYKFLYTFIIGQQKHLSTNKNNVSTNNVNIIYVYSKSPDIKVLDDNTSTYFSFYYRNNMGEDVELKSTLGEGVKVDPKSLISISIGTPWQINAASKKNFGITDIDETLQITNLSKYRSELRQIRQ